MNFDIQISDTDTNLLSVKNAENYIFLLHMTRKSPSQFRDFMLIRGSLQA